MKKTRIINTRTINVEGGELILKKTPQGHRVRLDMAGAPPHSKGGMDILASQGEMITPKKDRAKVSAMLDENGKVKPAHKARFERYRKTLPKDKPQEPINKAEDGASAVRARSLASRWQKGPRSRYQPPTSLAAPAFEETEAPRLDAPERTPLGLEILSDAPPQGVPVFSEPLAGAKTTMPGSADAEGTDWKALAGKVRDGAETTAALAPIIYNISQGLFGKVAAEPEVRVDPRLMEYRDTSAAARNAVADASSERNAAIRNLGAGNAGAVRAALQQSANTRMAQTAGVEAEESRRGMAVDAQNREILERADMVNLELKERNKERMRLRRERKQAMLAEGLSQASDLAQAGRKQRLSDEGEKGNDQLLMGMMRQLFGSSLPGMG